MAGRISALLDNVDSNLIIYLAVGGVIRANRKRPEDCFCKKLIARLTGFTWTITWDTSKPDGQTRRWAEDVFNACRGYLISDERTD